ncbi:hypothetical protein EDB80DRAFT_872565 [Ilyonectria destructans]|nr:hypothetical protein EDB80DRAFT_872565 [Ilyonectria destructans]
MDPFTAVTGAAGLVSLGITICDGLLTYCHNYRARSNDLLVLGQHAERLRTFLRHLEERQQGTVTNSALKSSINECLGACNMCLQEFGTFSDKYSQQPPIPSLKSQGKSVVRKLQYPFQRNMFEFFKQQMHEFQFALSSQILLMNYDLTADLRDTVSESNKLGLAICAQGRGLSDQVSSLVPIVTQNVDLRIAQMEESLQRRLEVLEKSINNFFEGRQRIEPASCTRLEPSSFSQDSLKAPHTHQHPQGQRRAPEILAPSFLRDNRTSLKREKKSTSQSTLLDFECQCATRSPRTHANKCLYSFQNKTRRTLVWQIKVFNRVFKYKILIQYSRHIFLRDLEVYPKFTVRTTCNQSPAFSLVTKTFARNWERLDQGLDPENLRNELQTCLIGVQQCFLDHKAWPTDINSFGQNLLHSAILVCQLISTEETLMVSLQFLKALVHMGVPVNDGCQTPLHYLLRIAGPFGCCPDNFEQMHVKTILSELFEYGAEIGVEGTEPLSELGGLYQLPLHRRSLLGIPCCLEYGRLSRAILEESEPDVRRILCTSGFPTLEKGPGGETPLHLAVSWARGVEILLELGGETCQSLVDAEDSRGDTPINYAIRLGQAESIRLFLAANARIDLENTQTLEELGLFQYRRPQSDEVIYLLGQELANRRKELVSFSLRWLSGDEALRFGLLGHQVLQEEASSVVQALQECLIPIPWQFQGIRPGSIYHSDCMSATLAESLFRAGFNHTNVLFHGFTPLMTVDIWEISNRRGMGGILDLVAWFVDHGADLHSSIPRVACSPSTPSERVSGCFQVIHRIAFETALDGYRSLPRILSNDEPRIAQLSRILEDPTTDPCNCYCARRGCSPASLFARGIWDHIDDTHPSQPHRQLISEWRYGVELINAVLSSSKAQTKAAMDIIRLSTFTRLGMKHTCCKYEYWEFIPDISHTEAIRDGKYTIISIMDPEDIAEIQEEDQHLATHLDSLVEEFDAKFMELGQPFSEFFLGYWWSRMDEVDAEKDELSCEDIEAIEEAGVILETGE